jgi:hypothetical protein
MKLKMWRLIHMWLRNGEQVRCLRVHRQSWPRALWEETENLYDAGSLEYYMTKLMPQPGRYQYYDFEVETNQRTITAHHHEGRTWIWDSDMPELEPRSAVAPCYAHHQLDQPWQDGWLPPD